MYYRPGWDQIGTGVEFRTPFLAVFLQACGEFDIRNNVFRRVLQKWH